MIGTGGPHGPQQSRRPFVVVVFVRYGRFAPQQQQRVIVVVEFGWGGGGGDVVAKDLETTESILVFEGGVGRVEVFEEEFDFEGGAVGSLHLVYVEVK